MNQINFFQHSLIVTISLNSGKFPFLFPYSLTSTLDLCLSFFFLFVCLFFLDLCHRLNSPKHQLVATAMNSAIDCKFSLLLYFMIFALYTRLNYSNFCPLSRGHRLKIICLSIEVGVTSGNILENLSIS